MKPMIKNPMTAIKQKEGQKIRSKQDKKTRMKERKEKQIELKNSGTYHPRLLRSKTN